MSNKAPKGSAFLRLNDDAGHTDAEGDDYENIPTQRVTPVSIAADAVNTTVLGILDYFGFPYTEEPGWRERQEGYNWYDDGPAGVMVHHTVSVPYPAKSAYPAPEGGRTDGRVICNFLVQPDGVINCIAAGPANYSAGVGQQVLYDDYVKKDVRFYGPQQGPYPSGWYGNRGYVNIETVAPGDGGTIPQEQENAVIALCAALCYVHKWSAWRVIGHLDHRGTKIDPKWDGEYTTPPYTIAGIQDAVNYVLTNDQMPGDEVTHFKIDGEYDQWEPHVWLLFLMAGGTIDPNKPSSQVSEYLPWKEGHKITEVQAEDFDLVADLTGLDTAGREILTEQGLYRYGKELASLKEQAYRKDSGAGRAAGFFRR